MASPVEFISYCEATQTFKVNDEALEILRSIEGAVGVISVSGRARQGKSYVLNQLLGLSGAFKVASTHRPCTKGIWLWSKPIPRTTRDGSKYHLVLLDTEGVDAFDQTGRYSTQVFCLAVLLSSLFVFNQMGPIDESSLNQLSLVSQMTKNVRVKADQGSTRPEELQAFTPSFLWLLRDFYLELTDRGEELTPKDYLEIALSRVEGYGPEVSAKNELRESIKSLFPERDCCMLVRPVADEASLLLLDALPQSALRPEFRDGVQNLLRILNDKTRPKQLGNTVITGSMLGALAEKYVSSINEGAVPTILTAWMSVADTETRRAAENAERKYEEEFDTTVQPEDDILYAEHQRCVALAQMVFDGEAIGEEHVRKPHRHRLLCSLKKKFDVFKGLKSAEASACIDNILMQAATDLAQNGIRMTAAEVHQHVLTFAERFQKETIGVMKWERLCSFVLHNVMFVLTQKASEAETACTSIKEAHQKVLDELQRIKKEDEEAARQLQSKYNELQGCHSALMQQSTHDKTELENVRGQLQRVVQEKQHTESMLSGTQSQLNSVTDEKSTLNARLEQLSMDFKSQQEALNKALQEASDARMAQSSQRRDSQEAMSRVQSSIADLQRERDMLMDGWQQERQSTERRISQGQIQLESLKSELSESQRSNAELRHQVANLQSVAASPSNGRQQRYSWDDATSLRMQLNETTNALKAAQERIKQLEEGTPNVQQSNWNSPARGSMAGNFADPVGMPSGSPKPAPAPRMSSADVDKMTISALKEWLVTNNFEDVVWEAQKGANPRKADWVRMVKERL